MSPSEVRISQNVTLSEGPNRIKVTVDDAAMFIGRFQNGALANLEATRFALGRKNHIAIEINGSKGSLSFDFEDMNRLKYFDNSQPADRQGFRDILVTQGGGAHPYVGAWWPPGHIIGYAGRAGRTPDGPIQNNELLFYTPPFPGI